MSVQELDYEVDESPQAPRSVYDYATKDNLREGLSSVTTSTPLAAASTIHIPFDAEPHPEYDIDWRVDNVDRTKSYEQTVEREMNRLLVLKSYLDLDYEKLIAEGCAFDGISRLAKKYFSVPICNIALLDIGRIWILSQEGKKFNLMPRKDTFCSHVIISREECYIVPDASQDPVLCNLPYVTVENGIRFYAACPLKSPEGYKIGTVCIMDIKPRPEGLAPEDQRALKDFARLAMEALVHQRELHRKGKQLEAAARQLASASHDLVTPLSVVQLSLSLLNEDSRFLCRLDDTQRAYLTAVSHSINIMADVCESLKNNGPRSDVTKSDAVRVSASDAFKAPADHVATAAPACTETSKLIRHLKELVDKATGNLAMPLLVLVDDAVPAAWIGDEVQILHICLHLLVNIAEWASTSHAQFRMRVRESSGQSELIFESTGIGTSPVDSHTRLVAVFDQQILSSISALDDRARDDRDGRFSPFEVLTSTDCRQDDMYEGFPTIYVGRSSLDPISVQIRSLGGSFGVSENAESRETTLWFAVPLLLPGQVRAHENKCDYDEVKPAAAIFRREERKRALVIDDSVVMRKLLCRALEQLGYEMYQAADGLEGLQRLKERTYDLVLLDFLMPVLDGLDCVRAYRKWEKVNRPGHTQAICGMSAHASSNDIDRAIMHGMTMYRPKPLSFSDLKQLSKAEGYFAVGAQPAKREAKACSPLKEYGPELSESKGDAYSSCQVSS